MIKILLADDFAIVRVLLHHVLTKAGDMQVVVMASDGQEAVNAALKHCPNVAVLDISMPVMDGLEATRQICTKCPETRVLMVSTHHTPQYIHHSIEAGALGYVLKDDISHDLVLAVRAIHQGGMYFSRQVAELSKLYLGGKSKTNTETDSALDRLNKFNRNITSLIFTLAILVHSLISVSLSSL